MSGRVPKDELVEGTKYIVANNFGIVFDGIFVDAIPLRRGILHYRFRDNRLIRNTAMPLSMDQLETYFNKIENEGLKTGDFIVYRFREHTNDRSVAKKISMLRLPNDIKYSIAEMTPSYTDFPYNLDVERYDFPGFPDSDHSVAKEYMQNHVLRPAVMQSIKEQMGRPNKSRRMKTSRRKPVGGKKTRCQRRKRNNNK